MKAKLVVAFVPKLDCCLPNLADLSIINIVTIFIMAGVSGLLVSRYHDNI